MPISENEQTLSVRGYLMSLYEKNKGSIEDLQTKLDCGIISLTEAETQFSEMKKQQLNIKLKLLEEVHVRKNGEPLPIPEKPNYCNNTYYRALDADRKQIYASSYEGLINKLCEHYGISLNDYSFGAIWNLSMNHYKVTHPGKDKTIRELQFDYKRTISEEFAKKDIRKMTPDDVDIYIINYLTDIAKENGMENGVQKKPPLCRLKAMKGVMNMTFDYAVDNLKCIRCNPAKLTDYKKHAQYCAPDPKYRRMEEVMLITEQMDQIEAELKRRQERKGYYVPYFAELLQRYCGLRPGEIFALSEEDVIESDEGYVLHVHKSQIEHRDPSLWYEIIDSTKNEKGVSKGGRHVPVAESIIHLIRNEKEKAGITSDFLVPNSEGNFYVKKDYASALHSLFKKLGFPMVGSYTFRRDYNCQLAEAGLNSVERSTLIGNSIQINEAFYTYSRNEIRKARAAFEGVFDKPERSLTQVNTNLVDFSALKKSRNPLQEQICND